MPETHEPATGVYRHAAFQGRLAGAQQINALARLGESDGLVHHQLGDGEAVVHLGHLHVLRRDAAVFQGFTGGRRGGVESQQIVDLTQRVGAEPVGFQLHAVLPAAAQFLQARFAGNDHRRTAVAYLRAVAYLEVVVQIRILQDVRIGIAGRGGLVQGHLDTVHMRQGVAVGVGVRLDGEMRQIAVGEAVGLLVCLGAPGQQRREGEVVDGALAGIVRGARQVIGTFTGPYRRLHFGADHKNHVQAGLDGLDGAHDADTAGRARRLDPGATDACQAFVCPRQHGAEEALVGKQLAGEIADVAALDEFGINGVVVQQLADHRNDVVLERRVLPDAVIRVPLGDEVGAALADERRDRLCRNECRTRWTHGVLLK